MLQNSTLSQKNVAETEDDHKMYVNLFSQDSDSYSGGDQRGLDPNSSER